MNPDMNSKRSYFEI